MIYPHGDKEWRDEDEGGPGPLTLKERWEIIKTVIGWKLLVACAAIDVGIVALIVYLLFW